MIRNLFNSRSRMPVSSFTSRRAQFSRLSPVSNFPLGRSHLPRRNMNRNSPFSFSTSPPPALIIFRLSLFIMPLKIKTISLSTDTNGFFYLHPMTNEIAVAEKLLEIQAIKLNLEKPFTWASGWKSPIYCDNRKTLSFPPIREFIKSEMCNLFFEEFPEIQYLAGVATAGIAWGAMAADQLKIPFIYVRSKPKEHGMGNQIEGFYEEGKQVLVIEDLISTGKSSIGVVHALRSAGLQIAGLVSIFNYGFDEAARAFAAEGVKTRSLTDYSTLIGLAVEKGTVSELQHETLVKWREDPGNWKAVSYF